MLKKLIFEITKILEVVFSCQVLAEVDYVTFEVFVAKNALWAIVFVTVCVKAVSVTVAREGVKMFRTTEVLVKNFWKFSPY